MKISRINMDSLKNREVPAATTVAAAAAAADRESSLKSDTTMPKSLLRRKIGPDINNHKSPATLWCQ